MSYPKALAVDTPEHGTFVGISCRQKKTILKLAEALNIQPQELWPDLEVADMLDAVASFQQDDYVMTEAEAESLRNSNRRNAPKIPVRSLPARRR